MSKIEELKTEQKQLAVDISRAEELNDYDAQMVLKRKFYSNKVEMIDLLSAKDIKLSYSAKSLKAKIASLKPVTRFETGIKVFDDELVPFASSDKKGLEVGSLIILGGQSGAGKSHMLLDILSNVAKYSKVLFFNFEMGERRLNHRLLKSLKSDEQFDNFIINSDSRDLDDLIMEIKLQAEENVVFFAIDSKMKISVKGSEAEHQKISTITKKLSEVAIKNDIIVFLINQISEENLKSGWKAFKGSGDQLYDADMALFLTISEDGSRMLECSKNRQDEKGFSVTLPKPVEVAQEYIYEETDNVSMSVL